MHPFIVIILHHKNEFRMKVRSKNMNPIDIMLDHKSIRKYKPMRVSPQHLSILLDVAKRTATSMGMQTFSIIRIVKPEIKAAIAEVCKQEYVKDMPELFIFVVDAYRNAKIMKEKGLDLDTANDADRFFQGWTDACLAAQNMVTAAELAGYGTVYLGSVLNDAEALIKILNLPEYTFPVVGLGLGMADQKPALKPRMPREANVFDDEYSTFDNYHEFLEDYDEEMNQYYDLRSPNYPLPKFTDQVVGRLKMKDEKRSALIRIAEKQGFRF